ncbi:hypothetical protein KC338_g55 [Hortaea werneckii]|nr:hypothetical protein KC338_g55 [Hortaea werneckii]
MSLSSPPSAGKPTPASFRALRTKVFAAGRPALKSSLPSCFSLASSEYKASISGSKSATVMRRMMEPFSARLNGLSLLDLRCSTPRSWATAYPAGLPAYGLILSYPRQPESVEVPPPLPNARRPSSELQICSRIEGGKIPSTASLCCRTSTTSCAFGGFSGERRHPDELIRCQEDIRDRQSAGWRGNLYCLRYVGSGGPTELFESWDSVSRYMRLVGGDAVNGRYNARCMDDN